MEVNFRRKGRFDYCDFLARLAMVVLAAILAMESGISLLAYDAFVQYAMLYPPMPYPYQNSFIWQNSSNP